MGMGTMQMHLDNIREISYMKRRFGRKDNYLAATRRTSKKLLSKVRRREDRKEKKFALRQYFAEIEAEMKEYEAFELLTLGDTCGDIEAELMDDFDDMLLVQTRQTIEDLMDPDPYAFFDDDMFDD